MRTFLAVLFLVVLCGCNSTHPLVYSSDIMVNETIVPYAEKKMATDPELDDEDREAMETEIMAMRALIEEAKKHGF